MRTTVINHQQMGHVLAALMPQNRLVVRLCMATGLRISDALALKSAQLYTARPTVREMKTGKTRRLYIPADLRRELQAQAGRVWVFEGRTDSSRHRTRQAVLKDIKRAQAFFRRAGTLPAGCNLGTHTARKMAAVDAYHRGGMPAAQKLLNHSDPAITALYALADTMPPPKRKKGVAKNGK